MYTTNIQVSKSCERYNRRSLGGPTYASPLEYYTATLQHLGYHVNTSEITKKDFAKVLLGQLEIQG